MNWHDPLQPRPIPPGAPLLLPQSVRALERTAQANGHTGLMQRAGEAATRLARAVAPHARRVWVACGPGNNGGDGFELARALHEAGLQVQVSALPTDSRPADAARALAQAQAAGLSIEAQADAAWLSTLGPQDLCIDALLGIGASRPLQGPMAEWIERMNALPALTLSLDAPTGLDGRSGQSLSDPPVVVRADHTLCFLAAQPGLWMGRGRDVCGQLWWAPLVTDEPSCPVDAWLNQEPTDRPRLHAGHKGLYGDVVVMGGESWSHRGLGMQGASVLAAQAALYAGAGRVMLCMEDALGPMPALPPELMLRRLEALNLERTTVVAGCGGGEQITRHMPALLSRSDRLVLDADGLNAVACDPALHALLRARAQRQGPQSTVLTPHPLEAARLLGLGTAQVQADRLGAARALAQDWCCTVILKGSGSVIASPQAPCVVNPTGHGRLSVGGTGDVLAGLVGARLAQGWGAHDAACAAAWQHGALAQNWPPLQALTASRLARALH